MATIKEVAKLAGVSISTVSRTLSKKVFVEEATRERVLKAVKQLAYKPNFMAKGLKEGYSKTLALVLPDIMNPFFPAMVKHIERHAADKGYSIILYDSGGDPRQEKKYMEAFKSHFVDGVIYTSASDDMTLARMLADNQMPVVVMNRESGSDIPCVVSNNREGARAVINHLVANGHRKIACLAVPMEQQKRYRERYEGCLEAFRAHGIDEYRRYLAKNVNTIEDACAATRRLLERSDPPTAIFVFQDMLALGVYSGVHDCGLRIPDDVSVAGFDNIYLSQHLTPPLTTHEQPVDKMAEIAVAGLIGQIEKSGKPGPALVEVKGSLVIRKSVRSVL